MNAKSKKFLFEYLNTFSPTGHEKEGQVVWLDYIRSDIDDLIIDTYGTAVAVINPEASFKVVIEAHADEISWFVNYISEDGFIHVIRNGGSDHQIAPSMRVILHTQKGPVKGVFGWPAIHIRKEKEEQPSMKNLFIDVGASSKKDVEKMGVHPGTVVTFSDDLMELNKNYLTGRALDNRMGGYMIAEVVKKLSRGKTKLPFCLYVVNAVQEEIGLRGAEMISRRLKPDIAIVTDVTHDTHTPMYDKKLQGDIKSGKGPVVSYAPAIHHKVRDLVIKTSEKHGIPIQRQASSRYTGTDADAFAFSAAGVASALISLPLRYMHTTVETVHKKDVEQVIALIYHCLMEIDPDQDLRYFS